MPVTLQSFSMSLGAAATFEVVLNPSQNIQNWVIQVVIGQVEFKIPNFQIRRWDENHGLNDWHGDHGQCCPPGSKFQPLNLATTNGTVVVTDARRGTFTFTITGPDLACLKPGSLFWQARRMVGDVGTAIAEGYISVTPTPVFPPCPPSLDQQFFVTDSGTGFDACQIVAILSCSDAGVGIDSAQGGPIPIPSSSSSSSSSPPSVPSIRQYALTDLTQTNTIVWPTPTLAGSDLIILILSAQGDNSEGQDYPWGDPIAADYANYNACIGMFLLENAASQPSTTGWSGYTAIGIEIRGGLSSYPDLQITNSGHGRGTNIWINGLLPVTNNLVLATFAIISPEITAISGLYSEVVAFGGLTVLSRVSGVNEEPYAFVTNATTEFWGAVIGTWN